jgi:hypothetical protein
MSVTCSTTSVTSNTTVTQEREAKGEAEEEDTEAADMSKMMGGNNSVTP